MQNVPQPVGDDERLARFETVTDPRLVGLGLDAVMVELVDSAQQFLRADTAAVLLVEPTGQYLVAAAASGIAGEVRQGVRVPIGHGFAGKVAEERKPLSVLDIDHAEIANPLLKEAGVRSLLGVPLIAADELLGVLHVGTRDQRAFRAEDVSTLELIADRIALAVQAELSEAARAAATALHHSLWPEPLPFIPGLELAARYVPASDGSVGGDWYDVISLPSGDIWLVVGDVVGRGYPAAMAMGRLRSALRAYVLDVDTPAELLTKLDRHLYHFDTDLMATVLCGVMDPTCRQLQWSSAGHLPPMAAARGFPSAAVELPIDMPLGTNRANPRHDTNLSVIPGAIICMYTDGLIERRGVVLDAGLEQLRRAVLAGSAESVCATVMASMVGTDLVQDDIALLILRRIGSAELEPLTLSARADPTMLATIRNSARSWLAAAGTDREATDDLVTAIGEAVNNVVEHAYGPLGGTVEIALATEDDDIVVTVRDEGRWRARRGSNRGRGLMLAGRVVDSLVVDGTDTGTTVTIRMRVADRRRS